MPRDIVLLLTHSGDYFTIDRVAEALSRRGVQPFRLNSDHFPMEVRLSARLNQKGLQHRIEYGQHSINIEEIRSVWMRCIWQPKLTKNLAPQFREPCVRQASAALDGFLDSLYNVRWVDDRTCISVAENKLRQLRVAIQVGLQIPPTLVTNNPDEVRAFFPEVKGKMIAKLLKPLSYSMTKTSFFVYTSAVNPQDLEDADSLSYSPMIFQQEIPKKRELRVVFVNGNFFVGALDASRYAGKTMDWRQSTSVRIEWERAELPLEICDRLKVFMAEFGLFYGALDFIQTPDDEYIFLEVNPCGEWGMIEKELGYPISEAIADTLLG